ncbi:MAG TPA: Rieske 2Fe-2S domain-containing protein [Bacteroidota bacterium]|nr:Rieske 2Fe-2S domain-containing protein [Bacteroidota bacterium]
MTRKSFIQRILSAWASICSLPVVYTLVQYIIPPGTAAGTPAPVPVGKLSEFSPGTVKLFRQGKTALFVRETESGQIRSFSGKCTHLGCLVEFLEEEQKFRCNCHGSQFDPDGKNLSGPAVRPLQPYRVEVRGDDIYITVI